MPPEADTMIRPAVRRMKVQARATPEEGEGTFEALVSDYSATYEIGWFFKERILQGCFADSIAARDAFPVCWNHAWQLGPIGDCQVTELDLGLLARGGLYLDLDPMVARLYRSMKAKAVDEWSIAFFAEEIVWTDEEPDVDQIVRGDLIEITSCFRGANPSTETIDLRGSPVMVDGGEEEVRRELIRVRSLIGRPDFGQLRPRSAGETRERKAMAVHHTGTTDGAWDAGENEKNLSNDDGAEVYRELYAWQDPDGDADTKSAYAFPHHVVDSDGKVGDASTVACSNGIGRLNGGSSSDDWWDDRSGIHSHLAAHLTDAGEEAPELKSDAAPPPARREKVGTAELRSLQRRLRDLDRRVVRARADAGMDDGDDDPDACDLAESLDAVLDELEDALDAEDIETASDLLTGANTIADELLEVLGGTDADEPDDEPAGSEAEASGRASAPFPGALFGSREGREALRQLAGASTPATSAT